MLNGNPILLENEIEFLAKLVKDNDLGEIFIEHKDVKVCIKAKKEKTVHFNQPVTPTAPIVQTAQPIETDKKVENSETDSKNTVKAPIVGTFYSAPSPDKPPFVAVGDSVKKGDVIMIIESMKIMNEVTSDLEGVVKEIFVNNGDAVEYNQNIMVIE
ncbi:MAG: acetyl-CoA carboxylase biotin carboxyl carrier protein [Oscillospiraceae bacterium]|jgi:acetyl-CoA carboxylase biotin carboxyl carrier protein|nr:acetyl-CoA carboxylase biotin carboxyl carrier protein [Oscillospiraceae bacterium]